MIRKARDFVVNMLDESREPEHVLEWCRNLVRAARDGAVWCIPRSKVVFKIDKKKQCLILKVGAATNADFILTRRVFSQIGWDVFTQAEYERQPNDDTPPKNSGQFESNN